MAQLNIEARILSAPDNRTRALICLGIIRDTLDSAIPTYYATDSKTLTEYGNARFALGCLKAILDRLLKGEDENA